jgi:hypothetical protein
MLPAVTHIIAATSDRHPALSGGEEVTLAAAGVISPVPAAWL